MNREGRQVLCEVQPVYDTEDEREDWKLMYWDFKIKTMDTGYDSQGEV